MELNPGTRVGNYQIERKLGEGGMGVVYSAFDLQSRARVALKSLSPDLMKSQELRDRFVREAQAMSRLQHPNIVQFMGWVDQPGVGWFIAMEFVQGKDFDKMIEQSGIIPPDRAVDLVLPALAALQYAHGLGVIHRDIKPANMMLLDDGRVKVLDFGTAKLVNEAGMTKLGQTIGTAVYMPPEQLLGRQITHSADLYAMGASIYEMVTGKLPYYHEDPIQLMKMMQQPPPPPSAIYRGNPPQLDAVIMRALAKEPAHRYRDAAEFAQALQQVRQTLPSSGVRPPMQQGAPQGGFQPPPPSGVRPPMQPMPGQPGMQPMGGPMPSGVRPGPMPMPSGPMGAVGGPMPSGPMGAVPGPMPSGPMGAVPAPMATGPMSAVPAGTPGAPPMPGAGGAAPAPVSGLHVTGVVLGGVGTLTGAGLAFVHPVASAAVTGVSAVIWLVASILLMKR